MENAKSRKKEYGPGILVIALCFILYLLFSFSSWHEPIMGDDVILALSIKAIGNIDLTRYFTTGRDNNFGIWHPSAYANLNAFLGRFFGVNETTARAVGGLSFLVSLVFIYLIAYELCRKFNKSRQIAALSCLVYSLNPLAIRGSMLIDMDGSILNAGVLLFLYLLIRDNSARATFRNIFVFGALFAAILWIKFATPIILISSLFIYYLFKRDRAKILRVTAIATLGIALFSATWLIYCYLNHRTFFAVFKHPLLVFTRFLSMDSKIISLGLIARSIWAIFIWSSPSFIFMAMISLIKISREKIVNYSFFSIKQLAFYAASVLIIYIFIGGVTHTFPKYHYAMMPVFAILISRLTLKEISFDRSLITKVTLLITGLVIYNIYIVGDPLYTINYALKEDIILHAGKFAHQIIIKELRQVLLILLTIPIAYLFFTKLNRPKRLILSLFITAIAFNISLSLTQMKADYNTVYCYGAKGVRVASDFIRSNTDPSSPIFAPLEIIWLVNNNLPSYTLSKKTASPDEFLETIRKNRIQCVAYGISGNTMDEYMRVFNLAVVQNFLKAGYTPYEIGSYQIWLKR